MLTTSVEELLRDVARLPPSDEGPDAFELGVGERLSLQGVAMPFEMAMALVGDALLAKGYVADSVAQAEGGHVYRYVRI